MQKTKSGIVDITFSETPTPKKFNPQTFKKLAQKAAKTFTKHDQDRILQRLDLRT